MAVHQNSHCLEVLRFHVRDVPQSKPKNCLSLDRQLARLTIVASRAANPLTISSAYKPMSRNTFHDLTISDVRSLTNDSVCISFKVPDDLQSEFQFIPGQYLTLRTLIDGQDERRSYSICSSVHKDELEVGIKRVPDGVFSTHAMALSAGETLSVMPPQGRFTAELGGQHHYLLVAAGSGITPCLSIAASVLEAEHESQITLIYGNQSSTSLMFRAELNALKDRYTERFQLFHVLTREQQDVDLSNGRIDDDKIKQFFEAGLISPHKLDAAYICGPEDMIKAVSSALSDIGMAKEAIHFELFTSAKSGIRPPQKPLRQTAADTSKVSITLDGTTREFGLDAETETVLAAAQRAGLDLPFSCEGGMCCTCRCRIVSGNSEMDVNYSLQDWEIEAGFTLACQTRPTGKNLALDFDDA